MHIRNLEKQLVYLENAINQKDKKIQKLNKAFLHTAIKLKLKEKEIYTIHSLKDYKKIKENYIINKIIFYKLGEEIKNEKAELINLRKEFITKLNSLKKEKLNYSERIITESGKSFKNTTTQTILQAGKILDPTTKETITPGRYFKKIEPGHRVFSPHDGVVKRIQFMVDNFAITIENQVCSTYIHGLGLIKVNIGDHLKVGQELGEAGFSEDRFNIYYEIKCKK